MYSALTQPMKKQTALIFISITFLFSLNSCISKKRLASQVKDYYEVKVKNQSDIQSEDWYTINDNFYFPNDVAKVEKHKFFYITFLLYSYKNQQLSYEIDPNLVANVFEEELIKRNLENSLGDKHLLINIDEVPGKFLLKNEIETFVSSTAIIDRITLRSVDYYDNAFQVSFYTVSGIDTSFVGSYVNSITSEISETDTYLKSIITMHLDKFNNDLKRMYNRAIDSLAVGLQQNQVFEIVEQPDIYIPGYEIDNVDVLPQFPGGEENLQNYINQYLIYPEWEKERRVEGTVYVSFTIDKEGRVKYPQILRSVVGSKKMDKEVKRLLRNMPNWTPGKKNDSPVNVNYAMPIEFRLDDSL